MLGIQMLGPILPRAPIDARAGEDTDTDPDADPRGDAHVTPEHAAREQCLELAAEWSVTRERRECEAWLRLVTVPGLGPVTLTALLERFGSASAAVSAAADPASFAERLRVDDAAGGSDAPCRIPGDLAERILSHEPAGTALARRVESLGLAVVTLDSPAYPARLRAVEFPPPVLFVRGSFEAMNLPSSVAIVGTRRATDKGRRLAGWIAAAASRLGAAVVSGLAVGIDGAAHAAAVSEGRRTVAVLGGGHAHLFPRAHERLAEAIVATGGAVISELTPDTEPNRGTFPRRNRIISALADATVVVEAGLRSGALITASWALEQGRECFIVPGDIDRPSSLGCNAFLRSFPGQARAVCGIPELLEDLGLATGDAAAGAGDAPELAAVLATLTETEAAVAERIAESPATADQLALHTGLPVSTILSTLTLLELRGLATSGYGRYSASGALAARVLAARPLASPGVATHRAAPG